MPDLIDREAILKKAFTAPGYFSGLVSAWDIVNAPTITPESLARHGRWIYGTVRGARVPICSECRRDTGTSYTYDYCPNCGAKMDLKEN